MKVKVILTDEDKIKDIDITSDNNSDNINIKKLFINPELKKDILYSISFVFIHMDSIVFKFKIWDTDAFKYSDNWYKLYNGENVKLELTPKHNDELTIKSHNGMVTFTIRFNMEKITTNFKIPFANFKPFIKNYIDCHNMINEYWQKIYKK
jgi:hypothetical protein